MKNYKYAIAIILLFGLLFAACKNLKNIQTAKKDNTTTEVSNSSSTTAQATPSADNATTHVAESAQSSAPASHATTKNADTSSFWAHPRYTEAGRVLNHVYDMSTLFDSVLNGYVVKRKATLEIYEYSLVNKDTITSLILNYLPDIEFILCDEFPPRNIPSPVILIYKRKQYTSFSFNQLVNEIKTPLSQYDKAILFIEMTEGIVCDYKILEVDRNPYVNPNIDFDPNLRIRIETTRKPRIYSRDSYTLNFFFEFDQNEIVKYVATTEDDYNETGVVEIFKSYSYE